MSREFLFNVLDKFAQVTAIIVETSKIKEQLDNKGAEDNLNGILERIKTEVNKLLEHAALVKELLDKQNEPDNCHAVSGTEDTNKTSEPESDIIESCQSETGVTKKPIIKLVDIKKLVEPKTLLANREVEESLPKRNVHFDDTVVLISSSDGESGKQGYQPQGVIKKATSQPQDDMNIEPRTKIRRKTALETIKKTRQSLQLETDSSSDEEVLAKKSSRIQSSSRSQGGTKRRRKQILEKLTWSDTSSDSDDFLDAPLIESTRINKEKNKKEDKQENENERSEVDWENDPKFNSKCYVKILKIPCEKLKAYYLEKLELLEIKKLRDVGSLSKKRRRSLSESSSGCDSKASKKSACKTVSKLPQTKDNSESEGASLTDDDIVPQDTNDNTTEPVDTAENAESSKESNVEQLAEDALNFLNSDKEEDGNSDKDDKEEESLNLQNSDKDKEVESDKEGDKTETENKETLMEETDEKGDTTREIELSTEDKMEETDEQVLNADDAAKKNEDKQDDETSEHAEKNDLSDDEENRDKDKTKKAWRKDKLLSSKLSSSDSEEEFAKFCKKRNKMQEEVLRKMKRIKKAILSDSDSDNKKDSADDFQLQEESSSSSESENEEEKEDEKPKTTRKRVKRVRDSSDEEDEEKSTRKQIRNIWSRDSLAETTKQAEAEERERKARIAEKQKKYNQIYENDCALNAKVEKVVLDFDEKNKKELLRVDDELVSKLKPHQASGIQFMWDACFESLERAKTTAGSGCILAHCMGLGKTLQVIALSHTLLVNSEETKVRKVLVVSPLNTVLNWVNEFRQWLPDNDDFEVYELVSFKQNYERQYQVKTWHNHGGVLIIGYDMFRNLSNPENKRISKKMRTTFQEALVDPGPDLVICDEGHLLKNEKTNISIAMNRLRTLRRIVLTGTPLQNNLKEYFCMVQFIKPNLLGTYKEYLNRFVNPITNGQYTDSTLHDIQIMRKRSHVLHKMLDGVVQRRDYSVLQPYLPPKHEYVLFLTLTETQIKLYQHYMDHFARRSTDGSNRTSFLFVDFQNLQRICTHPRVLLDRSIEMQLAKEKMGDSDEESEGSLRDFINDDEEEETSSSNDGSEDDKEDEKKSAPRKRITRAQAALVQENNESNDVAIVEPDVKKEWWQEYCDGDELNNISLSPKLFLLFEILKECEQIGDKVLVFSQSLYSLNVIEYFLERIHDATQTGELDSVGGYSGSWCLGLDYFRLDGSSSCDNRNIWCKSFNDPANLRARLFLISTKAGGLGINLVAANRVIIFDVSWNPSQDVQSIYRVYRFGQTKPCYIYRFVTSGTMEMKIYERQVTKQAISKRVIDEQQIDRHYNQNDLAELYKFDPKPEDRPIPLVPKDVLLGELLQKFEDRIYKYHEHQSLLENKEEEGLNEEERKAAWEEFENEKKQRNYLGGNNYLGAANIEVALSNIVRQENPTWTESQIRELLPALHAQLQEQVTRGDLVLYKRVQQEMKILHALQNQRLKEQFYQQQTLRMFQQQHITQQMAAAMKFHNAGNWLDFINQMPGTSRAPAAPNRVNPNEIIELND